jgi:hypothetical protein
MFFKDGSPSGKHGILVKHPPCLHTWPELHERAVLFEPGERGAAQVVDAGRGHHVVVGVEERRDDDGEDPELPVVERALADVVLQLLLHAVGALPRDGDACGRQLGLALTARAAERGRVMLCIHESSRYITVHAVECLLV